MKKILATVLVLSIIAFFGCDSGSSSGSTTGSIVTESTSVSAAAAARLYYPKGISSPTAATTMSAGYTQSLENVDWLSRALVSKGFVVLGLTPSNNWGMVSGWRTMHKNGIAKLQSFNSSHSVLKGKIDLGKLQTCGHSKGGGGSLWAASELRGTLKTAIGMAPYREEFSDSTLGSITAAAFVQAGGNDTLATNAMTRGEYNGLSRNISRRYVEYSGYSHLAWDGATGSTASRISGDINAWMRYYMYGDTSYASTLSNASGTQSHEWVNKGAPAPDDDDGDDNGDGTNGTFNGTYSIVAVHSGKALDTWEWGTTDGTNIVQYNYWGGEAQQFVVTPVDGIWHRITPLIASGQAVDVAGCVSDAGANIQTWTYWGGNCQQFRFQSAGSGKWRIIARNSEMCLHVLNASQDDGANVIQSTCLSGAEHQMFEMVRR
jgi:hypothetical protein